MTSFDPPSAQKATPIPGGFWHEIDHQLTRIAQEQPETFDAVREILLDERYVAIATEISRNGLATFDADSAFFAGAGAGGDDSLKDALRRAGWHLRRFTHQHCYSLANRKSGEALTYTEGDLARGDLLHH